MTGQGSKSRIDQGLRKADCAGQVRSERGSYAVCDECCPAGVRQDTKLAGWRWKCAVCADYDLCTKCVMCTAHHAGHMFVSAVPPGSHSVPPALCGMPSLRTTAPLGSPHEHVECVACLGQVVGLRFKCATCPNFDLCECCFRAGLPEDHDRVGSRVGSHDDSTHAWFLIRAPLAAPALDVRFGSLGPYIPVGEFDPAVSAGGPRRTTLDATPRPKLSPRTPQGKRKLRPQKSSRTGVVRPRGKQIPKAREAKLVQDQ